VITGLSTLSVASTSDISFLSHPRYISQLSLSKAGCIIVGPEHADSAKERGCSIVVDKPYVYWARLSQLWMQHIKSEVESPLIHPSAVIADSAIIHPTARIGPLCLVEAGVSIGAGTWLKSRVTVSSGCYIGNDCIIHSGVVIGADGFGFAPENGQWLKIEQFGVVVIGNKVEIGANTCIDRGAIEDTVIEDGVKLDNLIQIGHNVHIGKHTAMAGCVGVAGSAKIGAYCTVGGGAVILGHLELADHVHVSAGSVVSHSLLKAGTYSGVFPIDENASWQKNAASLRQLSALRERIRHLENNFNRLRS
jgi:UDP-3-O-[3-hydroxymyristoyl] glucosamine N-acyltransferase